MSESIHNDSDGFLEQYKSQPSAIKEDENTSDLINLEHLLSKCQKSAPID